MSRHYPYLISLVVILLVSLEASSLQSDRLSVQLEPLEKNTELLAVKVFTNSGSLNLIVDSGVQHPYLTLKAAKRLNLALMGRSDGGDSAVQVVRRLAFEADLSNGNRYTAYNGPLFVKPMSGITQLGADGILPPNLLFMGRCIEVSAQQSVIFIHKEPQCREMLDEKPWVKLNMETSEPQFPLWLNFLNVTVGGKQAKLLIDTGSTDTVISTELVPTQPNAVFRSFIGTSGIVKQSPVLSDQCVKKGNKTFLLTEVISSNEYNDGILGLPFLRTGSLVYISKSESYFIFNEEVLSGAC